MKNGQPKLISGKMDKDTVNSDSVEHGTKVIGVLNALVDNAGYSGLSYNKTDMYYISPIQEKNQEYYYSVSNAIISGALSGNLKCGDVLLLEVQYQCEGLLGDICGPVEIEPATFCAINLAVEVFGITVIEAAGNGSIGRDLTQCCEDSDKPATSNCSERKNLNLDHFEFDGFAHININRWNSGAIIVAAARPDDEDVFFSNDSIDKVEWVCEDNTFYGSRIDCFSWGRYVSTLTIQKNPDSGSQRYLSKYTNDFGHTSAASAIIAGTAVLLQVLSKRKNGKYFSPRILKDILTNKKINTKAKYECIGVMPNLENIFKEYFGNESLSEKDTC